MRFESTRNTLPAAACAADGAAAAFFAPALATLCPEPEAEAAFVSPLAAEALFSSAVPDAGAVSAAAFGCASTELAPVSVFAAGFAADGSGAAWAAGVLEPTASLIS